MNLSYCDKLKESHTTDTSVINHEFGVPVINKQEHNSDVSEMAENLDIVVNQEIETVDETIIPNATSDRSTRSSVDYEDIDKHFLDEQNDDGILSLNQIHVPFLNEYIPASNIPSTEVHDSVISEISPKRPPRKKSVSKSLSFVKAICDKIRLSSLDDVNNIVQINKEIEVINGSSLHRSYSCDDILSELKFGTALSFRSANSEEDILSGTNTLKRSQTIAGSDTVDEFMCKINMPALTKTSQGSHINLILGHAKRRLPQIPCNTSSLSEIEIHAKHPLPLLPEHHETDDKDESLPPVLPLRHNRSGSNNEVHVLRYSRPPAPPPKRFNLIDLPLSDPCSHSSIIDSGNGVYDHDGYLRPINSRTELNEEYSYADLPEEVVELRSQKLAMNKQNNIREVRSSLVSEHDYEYVPEQSHCFHLDLSSKGNSQFYFAIDESVESTIKQEAQAQGPPSPPINNMKKIRRKSEGILNMIKSAVISSNSLGNLPHLSFSPNESNFNDTRTKQKQDFEPSNSIKTEQQTGKYNMDVLILLVIMRKSNPK